MHSIPVQNPQADHCRLQEVGTYCQESRRLDQWVPELVLQERWGAQPHIHELKNRSFPASHTLDPMLLVQGWPGVAGLSWLTSRNKGPPFQWNGQSGVYKICFVPKLWTENSHSGHIFILSVKLDLSICLVLWQKHVHTPAWTWNTCGQECCNETAQHSSIFWHGRVLGELCAFVCGSVNVWYVCTMLGSLFRKDWACSVCIPEMSSWSCGGTVTMEAEMKTMWTSHRIY